MRGYDRLDSSIKNSFFIKNTQKGIVHDWHWLCNTSFTWNSMLCIEFAVWILLGGFEEAEFLDSG